MSLQQLTTWLAAAKRNLASAKDERDSAARALRQADPHETAYQRYFDRMERAEGLIDRLEEEIRELESDIAALRR